MSGVALQVVVTKIYIEKTLKQNFEMEHIQLGRT